MTIKESISSFVHDLFDQQVKTGAANIAIIHSDREITYSALDHYSRFIASVLQKVTPAKEQIVNVLMDSSIELVASAIAIFRTGGIYQPVGFNTNKENLKHQLSYQTGGIIITSRKERERTMELIDDLSLDIDVLILLDWPGNIEVISVKKNTTDQYSYQQNSNYELNSIEQFPDDANYIFHTSASTGKSKAIVGRHDSLAHFISWEIKECKIGKGHRISQIPPPTFDASLKDFFTALCSGATLCIPDATVKFNVPLLINWITESKITILQTVPSILRLISKQLEGHADQYFASLRFVLLAGEILFVKDLEKWWRTDSRQIEIINLYGSTESTILKTFHRISELPTNPGQAIHVGKAIDNAVAIVLTGNRLSNKGEIGDVYFITRYLTKGYLNNPELNRQTFIKDFLVFGLPQMVYKTGDLGRYIDNENNIEIIGRLDDQVKIGGVRMELKQVESEILSIEGISEVIAVAHANQDDILELVCYYTGNKTSTQQFREMLLKKMDAQMVPSYFMHMTEFPLGMNGKVNKKKLPSPVTSADKPLDQAQTETEQILMVLWKEVLKTENIGRKTLFYDAGGSSLKAIQLISKVFQRFKRLLKIADILLNLSVEQMAKKIDESGVSSQDKIHPIGVQPHYEVSSAQRRFWIGSLTSKPGTSDNAFWGYRIKGTINKDALEKAVQLLVERHEVLRTSFQVVEGSVRQFIHSASHVNFQVSFLEKVDTDDELNELISELVEQPFYLDKCPLFKLSLISLADNTSALVFIFHHIISDEWSEEIFMKELLSAYLNFDRGDVPDLPELLIQYKDYAKWHNDLLKGDYNRRLEDYWENQFRSFTADRPMFYDYPPKATTDTLGAKVSAVVKREQSEKINSFANDRHYSPFMVLISALGILLHRYTSSPEVVIGVPLTGRSRGELQNQLGLYLNTIPLKINFDRNDTSAVVLEKVKRTSLDGFEHGEFPFDLLLEKLDISIRSGKTKLFDVGFTWHENIWEATANYTGLEYEPLMITNKLSKSLLWIHAFASKEGIRLSIDYNIGLFREDTINQFMDLYVKLLDQIVADPHTKIAELELNDLEELSENSHLKNSALEIKLKL